MPSSNRSLQSQDSGHRANAPMSTRKFILLFLSAAGFGILASVLYGAWAADFVRFVSFVGVCCMVAGATLGVGALLGFLFGIPRSLVNNQGEGSNGESNPDATPHSLHPVSRHYSPNTNLEQISDWLTKILVGVGLTQLVNAQEFLGQIATSAAQGMGEPATPVFAISLILYYVLCGFLFSYIWTRLKLAGALLKADLSVFTERIQQSEERSKKAQEQAEIAVSAATIGIGKGQEKARSTTWKNVTPFLSVDAVEGIRTAKDTADTETAEKTDEYSDDPNKGKFGRDNTANNRILEATVSSIPDQADLCLVKLKVSSTEPQEKPLSGKVIFHLHPTFTRHEYPVQVNKDGVAELTLTAWGAFTVGAIADDGATRLELDLAEIPGAPKKFVER